MQKEKPIFGLRTGDTAKATTAEKATMHKELLGIETATTTGEKNKNKNNKVHDKCLQFYCQTT